MKLYTALALVGVFVVAAGWHGFKALRAAASARVFLRGAAATVTKPAALDSWRDVSFRTSDGVLLRAWYHPSATGSAVLMAHGWGQNRLHLLEESVRLARDGHGVLVLDHRAHGESGGTTSTLGDKEKEDVLAAVTFLAAQPDVDRGRIGALGFSMGAVAVGRAAALDDRISAVLLIAPYDDFIDDTRRDYAGAGAFGAWAAVKAFSQGGIDVRAVRPIDDLPRIQPRPLLLMAGELEPDAEMTARIWRAAPSSAAKIVVQGARHGEYVLAGGTRYLDEIAAFFNRTLGSRDQAPGVKAPEKDLP